MTTFVQVVAAFVLVAFATSLVVAFVSWLGAKRIDRLAPAAQARIHLAAVAAPGLIAAVVLAAALAPAFGWIADHCALVVDTHAHPHICGHEVAGWPALTLVALAASGAARLLWTMSRLGSAVVAARRAAHALDGASVPNGDLRVLDANAPQAFVLGLWRPTLYVTRALMTGSACKHLDAVLAHERAHLRRRDPVRRFLATFLSAFHIPGIAVWLDRRLASAQELAADDIAASSVGASQVASALVALTRARLRTPVGAFAFGGTDTERRVRRLLEERRGRDTPSPMMMLGLVAVLLVAIGAGADTVHHAVEIALGLLGG